MNETKKQDDIAEENSTQDAPVNEGEQPLEVKADAMPEGGEQARLCRARGQISDRRGGVYGPAGALTGTRSEPGAGTNPSPAMDPISCCG